jgi:hypothetical protein
MRWFFLALFTVTLLMLFTFAFAGEVKCYSHGTKIYDGYGKDYAYFDDGLFQFVEAKSKKLVFIHGDCVIITKQ